MFKNNKMVVPKSELHKVLSQCHSSTAHRGRDKTNNFIKGIYSEIPQQVVSLFTCLCPLHAQQKSITDHKKRPITNPIHAETFLSHLEVDLIDFEKVKCSCDNKSHQWVLHTKHLWLYALHSKTAEEVLEKLEALFWVFGFPQTLHTDNGKEFKNEVMQEFCQKHGIKQVHGAPRMPRTQGLVERNNRTVKENLTNILKEIQAELSSWCSKLGEAAYEKNITMHRAVREIPYRLVFGIDPKKESQMKVTADGESKLCEQKQERDQQTETANE
ncbi:KRAB-A domain-containing protein 2-like [Montipora foliosa]|uniref:KRAB-A domain-containing protein 2-like n=1 Tax=Montipora foliosa TaxID=591990 RepID=UPI0035F102EB